MLELFRHAWPEVDVDIRAGLAFDALSRADARRGRSGDLVRPGTLTGISFNPLFDYHPIFVAAAPNPLAAKDVIEAEDFRDQMLITYPVGRDKLDVFTELLTPAKVEPRAPAAGGTDGGDPDAGRRRTAACRCCPTGCCAR